VWNPQTVSQWDIHGWKDNSAVTGIASGDACARREGWAVSRLFAAAKSAAANADPLRLSLSYRDKDRMRFEAKAQMLYVIRAASPYPLPTTMRLYSGSGTVIT
jgi:hypothetical protein